VHGRTILLHLLVYIFYVLQWDIISQINFKKTKVFFLLCYFNKTALGLFLGFPYFELRNIYRRFRQSVYSSEFVHRYWSGLCTLYVVRFSHIVFNIGNKQFIISRLIMWCMTICLCMSSTCWQIAYMVK